MAKITIKQGGSPATPPAGYANLWVGVDGRFYSTDPSGTITPIYGIGPAGPAGPAGPVGPAGAQGSVSRATMHFLANS